MLPALEAESEVVTIASVVATFSVTTLLVLSVKLPRCEKAALIWWVPGPRIGTLPSYSLVHVAMTGLDGLTATAEHPGIAAAPSRNVTDPVAGPKLTGVP